MSTFAGSYKICNIRSIKDRDASPAAATAAASVAADASDDDDDAMMLHTHRQRPSEIHDKNENEWKKEAKLIKKKHTNQQSY